ncbi:hypothetical protein L345_02187, partial [Ophiophagus hannah]
MVYFFWQPSALTGVCLSFSRFGITVPGRNVSQSKENIKVIFQRVFQDDEAPKTRQKFTNRSESEGEDEQLTESRRVAQLAMEETGEGQSQAGQSRKEVEQGKGGLDEDQGPPSPHPMAHREERRREQCGLRGLRGKKGP